MICSSTGHLETSQPRFPFSQDTLNRLRQLSLTSGMLSENGSDASPNGVSQLTQSEYVDMDALLSNDPPRNVYPFSSRLQGPPIPTPSDPHSTYSFRARSNTDPHPSLRPSADVTTTGHILDNSGVFDLTDLSDHRMDLEGTSSWSPNFHSLGSPRSSPSLNDTRPSRSSHHHQSSPSPSSAVSQDHMQASTNVGATTSQPSSPATKPARTATPPKDDDADTSNENAVASTDNKGPKKSQGRKLPKHVTDLLRKWLLEHADHPYPSESEKRALCDATGLSISQLSNWMINARRRVLVPASKASFGPSISSVPYNLSHRPTSAALAAAHAHRATAHPTSIALAHRTNSLNGCPTQQHIASHPHDPYAAMRLAADGTYARAASRASAPVLTRAQSAMLPQQYHRQMSYPIPPQQLTYQQQQQQFAMDAARLHMQTNTGIPSPTSASFPGALTVAPNVASSSFSSSTSSSSSSSPMPAEPGAPYPSTPYTPAYAQQSNFNGMASSGGTPTHQSSVPSSHTPPTAMYISQVPSTPPNAMYFQHSDALEEFYGQQQRSNTMAGGYSPVAGGSAAYGSGESSLHRSSPSSSMFSHGTNFGAYQQQ
ncbi:hypothetical protein FRB99_002008 [Tulasnella sp. 403]|nr:hypothetical protein FRB99_002008 [Tulasnella sp. 403]